MPTATPFSSAIGRRMPPPGWTWRANSGGTVGERSRQPRRSSSKAGSRRSGTGPSSAGGGGSGRGGRRGAAGRTSRRGRRASRPGGRRNSGGRARRGRGRGRRAAGGRGGESPFDVERDAALHRRSVQEVDDGLARDRDVARREALGELTRVSGRRRTARTISATARSAWVSLTPSWRSRRTLPLTCRGAVRACSHGRSSASTRCNVAAHQPRDRQAFTEVASALDQGQPRMARASWAWTASRWRTTSPSRGWWSHCPRARAARFHSLASCAAISRFGACVRQASSISSASWTGSTASMRTSTYGTLS